MAEVFAITAGVGSVLKAIGSTGVYLNSAAGASREVQDIAKNVCATEKILKSLEASIETFPQSDYFYDIWSDSAKSVIEDVKTTIEELNSKLPQPRINGRLSTFERVKWPLAREETVLLLEHLKAYIQMLTMVQNALVQGSMLAVHNTAKGIEEISTRVGTLPSSRVQRALVVAPNNLQMAILPEESASQIAIMTPDQPSEPVAEAVMSSCPRVSSDQPVEIVRSQERTNNTVSVVEPRLIMECVDTYEFTMNLVEIRFQDYKRRDGKYDRLGKGKLLLTLSQDHARVFVKYKELHVPSPNKRNVWEGYFELHSYRIDVLVEQFARLVWFNSNEIQGISFKNEVTVELHFANGRADKLLFMNGFNKLLRDAAEYARYVNVRKAEAIALRQQRPQLPYLHQLDQFHQLHQQPIAHQQTHRDNDCQYAHLSNRQEYFQRMVTEEHLQPSTSLQYAQASNISNTVPNMSYEQYLAQNSTRNVIEQRSDRQNMHKPDPAQHSQHHLVKTSPFYYKLVKLGRSSGSEQPCTPEHLIESNSTEDFAATSITTDAEPQPPAKQPTELHRERVQTQPKISVEVISSRNVALDVLLSHFFMKLIFPLIALLATCQELRVYLRCISDVISEQLERGLE